MKIQTKILLIVFSLVLVTGVVATIVSGTVATDIVEEQVCHRLETIAQSRKDHIETVLRGEKEALEVLATSLILKNFLTVSNEDSDYAEQYEIATARLNSMLEASGEFTKLSVLDESGVVLASTDEDFVGSDRSTTPSFLQGRERTYIKDVHACKVTGEPAMSIATPIMEENELLGIMIAGISLTKLNEIVRDTTGLGETGETYLVNKDGYMITPSRFVTGTFLEQKVDTENARCCFEDAERFGAEEHEHEAILGQNYLGTEVLGLHQHIPETGWCLLAEISEEEAFASIAKLTQAMLLLVAILLVVSVILAVLISRTIARPIVKLHQGTEAIAEGNLDHKVGTKARDEIGQLSRAFDDMTAKLKESREELEEYSEGLEKMVEGRTAELAKANEDLRQEITERERAEDALKERVKELRCLYGISSLAGKPGISLEEILQGSVNIIPPAWQYPEITCARIMVGGDELRTENFTETMWKQASDIMVWGERAGTLQVCYLEERPGRDEGPFLREERRLLDAIAERLGRITERKRVEEALRESEKSYRMLFQNSIEAVFTVDIDGNFTSGNKALEELSGRSLQELVGASYRQIVAPEDVEFVFKEYNKLFRTGEPIGNLPYDIIRRNGERRLVEGYVNIVKKKDRIVGFQGTLRDITERKRMEGEREALLKDLEELNRKLEESNKELQDFAYIASHDLREPLRKISSFGALLRDSLEDKLDEDQRENFEFMIDGAKRMQDMIDDLLTYSRLGTSAKPPELVDLNKVIEDLRSLELATLLAETRGTIHVSEPLPPVRGDASQIHQLLQNLIGNGLKFRRQGIDPQITIRGYQIEDNLIRVEVQDNGIGIAVEYHEQIFTMFKRLHSRERYGGTGIGLAVCKKIVDRHGGDIGVNSTPGEGSTCWFTLPGGSRAGNNQQKE